VRDTWTKYKLRNHACMQMALQADIKIDQKLYKIEDIGSNSNTILHLACLLKTPQSPSTISFGSTFTARLNTGLLPSSGSVIVSSHDGP
jgi:hypothetical protein